MKPFIVTRKEDGRRILVVEPCTVTEKAGGALIELGDGDHIPQIAVTETIDQIAAAIGAVDVAKDVADKAAWKKTWSDSGSMLGDP